MKNQVCKFIVLASVLALVQPLRVIAADAPATPGSAAETDTKNQENNPPGPADQSTAHPNEGTKKKKKKTHAPAPTGTNQSGDTATKTPQKDAPPSSTGTTTTP